MLFIILRFFKKLRLAYTNHKMLLEHYKVFVKTSTNVFIKIETLIFDEVVLSIISKENE
jgi:hypothetical protein